MQAERRNNSLKSFLDEKEKELTTAAQRLQEALSASAAHNTTIKQLEEAVQRYVQTSSGLSEYVKQNGELVHEIKAKKNYAP